MPRAIQRPRSNRDGQVSANRPPSAVEVKPSVITADPYGPTAPERRRHWAALAASSSPVRTPHEHDDFSALRSILSGPPAQGSHSGSSSAGSDRTLGRTDRDLDILILTIAGHTLQSFEQVEPQTQQQLDALPSAAFPTATGDSRMGRIVGWDSASLLQALDQIPAAPLSVTSGATSPLQPGAGSNPPGAHPAGGAAEPANGAMHFTNQTSTQQLHVPDALRGLLASIAASSPLPGSSEDHQAGFLPYSPSAASISSSPEASLVQPSEGPTARTFARSPAAPPEVPPPALAPASEILEALSAPAATRPQLLQEQSQRRQWRQQPGPAQQVPSSDMGFLLGPHIAGRGPAAAPLVCAAVGVSLPPWAVSLLPPASAAAPGLRLDPSLEWALGVLSERVAPLEPRPSELRLANRILAAHLGPTPAGAAVTSVAAASRSGAATAVTAAVAAGGRDRVSAAGRAATSSSSATLPWPLVLPVLDAVAWRLSPPSVLALLRVICAQVGPNWRRELAKQHQAHLAATLQACFRTALRNPDAVSPSAAAGLLAVMSRLNMRSPAACSLLVARILAGVAAPRAKLDVAAATEAPAAATSAAAAPTGDDAPAPGVGVEGEMRKPSLGQQLHSAAGGKYPRRRTASPTHGSDTAKAWGNVSSRGFSRRYGTHRASRLGASKKRSMAGGLARKSLGRLLELGPRRAAQLRWVCTALSTLSRLHIPSSSLPRRAVTKLLWAALFSAAHWTPAVAAALLVWAHRLACRPPAAFLGRYARVLLTVPAAPRPMGGFRQPSPRADQPEQQQYQQQQQEQGQLQQRGGHLMSQRYGSDLSGPGQGIQGGVHAAPVLASDMAATVGSSAARRPRQRCLMERMTASQLFSALESLVAQYGSCTAGQLAVGPAAAAAARTVATPSSAGEGAAGRGSASSGGQAALPLPPDARSLALMHRLAAALTSRFGQLRRNQLCRLPLLLSRVGQPTQQPVAGAWEQVYLLRARGLLPSCDAVDVMLLLRGLAAGMDSAERRELSEVVSAGTGGLEAAGPAVGVAVPSAYVWLGAELADDALRQYAVLLPSVSLYHTAAVLESLARLWRRPPQMAPPEPPHKQQPLLPVQPLPTQTKPKSPPPAAVAAAAAEAAVRTDVLGSTPGAVSSTSSPSQGHDGPAQAPAPTKPEADLRRRRLTDLASERDFLLQQLDEHVAACLLYGGGMPGSRDGSTGPDAGTGRRGRGRDGDDGEGPGGLHSGHVPPGLVVKVLAAYGLLQRCPPPPLQGALENALVAGAEGLGTQGWQRVREAYRQLGLQPGRELSVALLTFV